MDRADSPISHSSPALDEGHGHCVWKASALALFLPGLVVAAGYGAFLLALVLSGKGEGALARVCLLVLVIVVPLLLAHAGLRLSTTQLTLHPARLEGKPVRSVRGQPCRGRGHCAIHPRDGRPPGPERPVQPGRGAGGIGVVSL